MVMAHNYQAALWRNTALATLATAKRLRDGEDHRSCVSRSYYAAYQAVTSVCIAHGDAVNFPPGWNNPKHEQLPDLVGNNGDFSVSTRRTVRRILRELRLLREDADYRMGRTVNAETARAAMLMVSTTFERLEIEHGRN
jgi:uncharacterized protein (UPF0332 family)